MNTLSGHISDIKSSEHLTLVSVRVGPYNMSAIIIDTPDTVDYLNTDAPVQLVFKETEVIIGIGNGGDISLRNQLKGIISDIDTGPLLSRVRLKTEVGIITAVITSNAVASLQLTVGKEAIAMIKTNEMMLAH